MVAAEAQKMLRSVESLYEQIDAIDIEQYFGEELMWSRLEALAQLIRKKLRELGRRENQ
jgi:hypothetical protein